MVCSATWGLRRAGRHRAGAKRHRVRATRYHRSVLGPRDRLRLALSLDDYARRPIGSALAGASFLTWCATPELVGTVHFGHRDATDARTLLGLYPLARHPALHPPLRRIVDGRGLAGIDDEAWTLMAEGLRDELTRLRGLFARQAVVVEPGLSGARKAALLPALGPDDTFRLFTDASEAYAWADPVHGPAAQAMVASICADLGPGDLEPKVRAFLASHLRQADVDRCAAALGLSARSLQRGLRARGRTFRGLLSEERARAAQILLAADGGKIDTVARAVGCSSASQLGVVLRRSGLPAPSTVRAEARKRRT